MRKTYEEPKDGEIIKTKDGKEWPIDAVKELYIRSDYTIEKMAQELRMPKSKLERLARTGSENWDKLKKEYQDRRLKVLSKRFDDTLVEKQSLVQRIEELTLMEMAYRVKEVEDHFAKYGDFFVRNVEGEILRDGRGQAIKLQLPNSVKDLTTLKGLEEAKVTNATLLSKRLQDLEHKKQEVETVDVARLMNGDSDNED